MIKCSSLNKETFPFEGDSITYIFIRIATLDRATNQFLICLIHPTLTAQTRRRLGDRQSTLTKTKEK